MYGNRESWIHESSQDSSIANNKNRIKRCRGYIMRTLANANKIRGNVVADYISGFDIPNQQRQVNGVRQALNFLDAALRGPGEGFWHEWDQNHKITNAAVDVSNLEATIDPFFRHLLGIAPVSQPVLGNALADFGIMAMPANPHGSVSGALGALSDLLFTGNSSENNTAEFFQNQNIRAVSNRLDWIEAKISVIDTTFQNAFNRAIHAKDFAAAGFISQIVPGLNQENQRLVNQMLDNGIEQGNAEAVRLAIGLGAQVNVAFNKDLPLLKAVQANNYDIVHALVVVGHADVNSYHKSSCCESFANFFRFFCCMNSRTTTLLHVSAVNADASVAGLLYQHANNTVRAQIDGAGHTASYYCPTIAQVALPAPAVLVHAPFAAAVAAQQYEAVPAPQPQYQQYAGVYGGAFEQAPPPYDFNEEHKFPAGFLHDLRQRQVACDLNANQQHDR